VPPAEPRVLDGIQENVYAAFVAAVFQDAGVDLNAGEQYIQVPPKNILELVLQRFRHDD